MYRVTFEQPGTAKGPIKHISFGLQQDLEHALGMAEAIFKTLVFFAELNTPSRIFESRRHVVPTGVVVAILLTNSNPYRNNSASLYGTIRCEEIDERETVSVERSETD